MNLNHYKLLIDSQQKVYFIYGNIVKSGVIISLTIYEDCVQCNCCIDGKSIYLSLEDIYMDEDEAVEKYRFKELQRLDDEYNECLKKQKIISKEIVELAKLLGLPSKGPSKANED